MRYDPISVHTYDELPLGYVAFNLQKAFTVLKQTFENGKMSLLMKVTIYTDKFNEESWLAIPYYALDPISGTRDCQYLIHTR